MTFAKWIDLDVMRPEPEVYVLCWDGKTVSIDWFGSLKRPYGTAYTHWAPFQMPPGAKSDMLDGRRAFGPSSIGLPILDPSLLEVGK